MIQKKIIQKVNQRVIDFIKSEVAAKKERHKEMIKSINPGLTGELKKMKKLEC